MAWEQEGRVSEGMEKVNVYDIIYRIIVNNCLVFEYHRI